MGAVRIERSVVEPIAVYVTRNNGLPRTGLAVGDIVVKIQRLDDSFWLDWSDLTFKAKGAVVDLDADTTEDDATDNPGVYEVAGGLDFSAVVGLTLNDNLLVIAEQVAGATSRVPPPAELKVGQWVRKLVATNTYELRVIPLGDPLYGAGPARIELIDPVDASVAFTAPAFEDASQSQQYRDKGMNSRDEFV